MSDKNIITLITEYLHLANDFTKTISNTHKPTHPLRMVVQKTLPREGSIPHKGIAHYSFHGNGCYVEYEDGVIIDFDYNSTEDLTVDRFEAWKLKSFIESKGILLSLDEIQNELIVLETKKQISRSGYNLYQLCNH